MSDTIAKVIYGTLLLALIIHTPKVSILITLDANRSHQFHAAIKGFRKSILLAALFTMLAVLPIQEFNGIIKPGKKLFVLLVMPWVSTCCLMFVTNSLLLFKITERTLVLSSWHCFAKALMVYCILFGFATEQIMHWYSIYHLHDCNHSIEEKYPPV
ncbi:uncharacterized protein LOC115765322 [Drosophila novamexicana]|uniref:uncharacterized protein LOC115765322 n=1 Tax=Drosophila novamexicana TaxID=47314 RepID=UPI0011E5DAF0|nr:uncharacterized protein LOC115765322 [Drosophila novamexicana]